MNDELVELIRAADRLVIFTGAGLSTRSGIPDYRGPSGVWKTKQPVLYQDFMASEAARLEYWGQKSETWKTFRDAEPNAAHEACAALERADKLHLLVTQNIDGLHAKGGVSAERLVELHGTNGAVECQSCHDRSDPATHFEAFAASGEAPQCSCGGWLKPATISFGQALKSDDLMRAGDATQVCDLMIAMGSTLSVQPAASIPVAAAKRGVPYVIINRGVTEHDGLPFVTLRFDGDVVDVFAPAVKAALAD